MTEPQRSLAWSLLSYYVQRDLGSSGIVPAPLRGIGENQPTSLYGSPVKSNCWERQFQILVGWGVPAFYLASIGLISRYLVRYPDNFSQLSNLPFEICM